MGIESKLLEESITNHAAVNNSCVLKVTYIQFTQRRVTLPQDIEILDWCPAGSVLPHGVKVPL